MSMPTVYERVARLIGSLDNHTNVVFLPENDGYGRKELPGIVRDMPVGEGQSRRVTMRSGSEFFIDAAILEQAGLVGLKVVEDGIDIVLVKN